jgi:carbohydrate-selective porin OprB
MKAKTARKMSMLQRFASGLVLALCIGGLYAPAVAANEAAADSATAKAATRQATGKLSLTRVDPAATPVSDYTGDIWHRSTLLGDPGGKRQQFYEDGVMFDAALTQVFQGVSSGGKDTGDTVYTGLLEYGLALDTGKLNLWPAGLITFNAQTGFASGFPLEAGNVSPANFTELYPTGDKPQTVLVEYYWTQVFSKDISLVTGRINAVNFFDLNRLANNPRTQFMNLSLDNDPLFGAFLSFSTYGMLGHWQITDNFSFNPAVFDPNTQPGNYFSDLFSDIGLAAEADLTWKFDKNRDGTLRIVGIYVNKDTTALDNPHLVLDAVKHLPFETKSGNWIAHLNVEQYLWKPSSAAHKKSTVKTASFDFQEPGIGLYGRFGYTPEDRNLWNIYASGGIAGRGIIPNRPYDRLGIGVYWLKESNDLDDQPGDLLEDEVGFEAFYNLAVTPWAQLSFDVQWINSGETSVDDAVVLGMRLFTQF